jgi:hypothetical protein
MVEVQALDPQQTPLVGYIPTIATNLTDARAQQLNSKGVVSGTAIIIPLTTQPIGGTDHKYDVGFVLCVSKCLKFTIERKRG